MIYEFCTARASGVHGDGDCTYSSTQTKYQNSTYFCTWKVKAPFKNPENTVVCS